jgi:iron complex outermembrane receptor protein
LNLAQPAFAANDETAAGGQPSGTSDILVTGQVESAAASGKDTIPLIETPQAISIVTQEDLEERGVTRIADALFSVAGASRSSTYGFYDAYTLRGFDAAYGSLYLDGLINESGGGGSNNELFGLQSVEVVKGPASSLFGGGSLGGIINLVSKRPVLNDSFLDVSVSTGSYDLIEGTVDANVPLNAAGTLAARVVGLYRDAESFVQFAGYNRIYLQPSVTWQIAPSTTFTAIGTYKRDDDAPWGPLPAYGTVFPLADGTYLPYGFAVSNGGEESPSQREVRSTVGYFFDHQVTETLRFSQTARYMHRTTEWDQWLFVGDYLARDENGDYVVSGAPTDTLGRIYYGPYDETYRSLLIDNRLTWKANTGLVRHNLLGGIDYRTFEQDYQGNGDYDPTRFPLDIRNPDYFVPLDPIIDPYTGSDHGYQLGFYAQDHLEIGDALTLTLNGRWDRVEYNGELTTAFSPRIGGTVKLTPGVSLYATYARSFTPQFGYQIVLDVDNNGDPVLGAAPPERGRNIEAGLKLDIPASNLAGMLSVYKLTRLNVLTSDPNFPLFSRVSGEQQSQGIEVELHWRPDPALNLDVAYAYNDATYIEDTSYPAGERLPNVPKHVLSLYGRYVVQKGMLSGLGINFGAAFNSARNNFDAFAYPDQNPHLTLAAYWLVNAGLSYSFGDWEAQVHVNNLLDERYFSDACCLTRVTPGEPRNWRLTIRRSF